MYNIKVLTLSVQQQQWQTSVPWRRSRLMLLWLLLKAIPFHFDASSVESKQRASSFVTSTLPLLAVSQIFCNNPWSCSQNLFIIITQLAP